MSNTLVGMPAVLFFLALAVVVMAGRRVSKIDALILVLFGFYLGGTGVAKIIDYAVGGIFSFIGGIR